MAILVLKGDVKLQLTNCCGVCSSEVQCFSMGWTTPKNRPFTWGILTSSNTWFLGPLSVIPKWRLEIRSVHPFLPAYECDQQTHTGRDHAILFCRNKRRPKNKKRCSSKLDIGPDHPCCRINIKFCMEVIFLGSSVVLIKVHQNRLSSFRDVGVEIGPFRLLLWELYINWFLPRDAMLARYMLWPCMWHCSGRWIRA